MESGKNHRSLRAPSELVLVGNHWLGPFAGLAQSSISVEPLDFAITSRSDQQRIPLELSLDSLSRERNGECVDAQLTLSSAGAELVRDPESFELQIAGKHDRKFQLRAQGVLSPDIYASTLVLRGDQTEDDLEIPIRVRVSTHWMWPLLLMTLGLLTLGLVKWLAGAADAKYQMASILSARQSFHEFIESEPPAEALEDQVESIDAGFVDALSALKRPRSRGLVDRRRSEAQLHSSTAIENFDQLRSHSDSMARLDIDEVDELWAAFDDTQKKFDTQLAANEQSLSEKPDEWPRALARFLQTQRQLLHAEPWRETRFRIEPQIRKTHIAAVTGNHQRAQELATTTKGWIRRAARENEKWMAVLQSMHVNARRLNIDYLDLEHFAADTTEQAESADEITAKLTEAQTTLERDPSINGFRQAHSLVLAAQLLETQVRSQQVQKQVELALHEAGEATSMDYMDAALDEITSKHEMLNLYERHVQGLNDADLTARLSEVFAELRRCLDAGDKKGLGEGMAKIFEGVEENIQRTLYNAKESASAPYNRALESDLVQLLTDTQHELRIVEPNRKAKPLQQELDAVWQDYGQIPDEDRMQSLVALLGRVRSVSDQAFTISLSLENITTEARSSIAENSGVAAAIAFAEHVTSEPWPMEVTVTSDRDQIVVGRDVAFDVRQLPPDMPSSAAITFDFGDGTSEQFTADALRRSSTVIHQYEEPRRFVVRATHSQDGQCRGPGSEGKAILIVAPSPISSAYSLADGFFHLQFFLSLAIGIVVQLWQNSGERPFGSLGADYISAFAWGVGIDASVGWLAGFAEQLTPLF